MKEEFEEISQLIKKSLRNLKNCSDDLIKFENGFESAGKRVRSKLTETIKFLQEYKRESIRLQKIRKKKLNKKRGNMK